MRVVKQLYSQAFPEPSFGAGQATVAQPGTGITATSALQGLLSPVKIIELRDFATAYGNVCHWIALEWKLRTFLD